MQCYICGTPYERRFGWPSNGPVIPFGAMVEYRSISSKDQSRLHQFRATVLLGIFLGDALWKERIWKGDIMAADIEELEEMDASELHARRLDANEVLSTQKVENSYFQSQIEKNLRVRTTSENIHVDPGSFVN